MKTKMPSAKTDGIFVGNYSAHCFIYGMTQNPRVNCWNTLCGEPKRTLFACRVLRQPGRWPFILLLIAATQTATVYLPAVCSDSDGGRLASRSLRRPGRRPFWLPLNDSK